jgi:hypothetical protein
MDSSPTGSALVKYTIVFRISNSLKFAESEVGTATYCDSPGFFPRLLLIHVIYIDEITLG